jgi:hypothetical protein
MPRDLKAHENTKRNKARRAYALERRDLREPSEPRVTPVGATSPAMKAVDPASAAAIEAFLARRPRGQGGQ